MATKTAGFMDIIIISNITTVIHNVIYNSNKNSVLITAKSNNINNNKIEHLSEICIYVMPRKL